MADGRQHPDDGVLLALLDGELADERRSAVEAHVEGCDPCASRLDALTRASRRLAGALETLDVPPPDVEAAELVRAGRRAPGPGDWSPEEGSRRGAALLKAAALVLAFAGAAAAAVPGSPVHDWLSGLVRAAPEAGDAAPADRTSVPDREGVPGVAVQMEDGRVTVLVTRAPSGTSVTVRLTDGTEAGVWARGGRYRTAPGRIEVVEPSPDEVLVEIPSGAVEARITVNGRTVWTREDGELRLRVDEGPAPGESPG